MSAIANSELLLPKGAAAGRSRCSEAGRIRAALAWRDPPQQERAIISAQRGVALRHLNDHVVEAALCEDTVCWKVRISRGARFGHAKGEISRPSKRIERRRSMVRRSS